MIVYAGLTYYCRAAGSTTTTERAVLPGAGHSVPRLGEPFNDVLVSFIERAAA